MCYPPFQETSQGNPLSKDVGWGTPLHMRTHNSNKMLKQGQALLRGLTQTPGAGGWSRELATPGWKFPRIPESMLDPGGESHRRWVGLGGGGGLPFQTTALMVMQCGPQSCTRRPPVPDAVTKETNFP